MGLTTWGSPCQKWVTPFLTQKGSVVDGFFISFGFRNAASTGADIPKITCTVDAKFVVAAIAESDIVGDGTAAVCGEMPKSWDPYFWKSDILRSDSRPAQKGVYPSFAQKRVAGGGSSYSHHGAAYSGSHPKGSFHAWKIDNAATVVASIATAVNTDFGVAVVGAISSVLQGNTPMGLVLDGYVFCVRPVSSFLDGGGGIFLLSHAVSFIAAVKADSSVFFSNLAAAISSYARKGIWFCFLGSQIR